MLASNSFLMRAWRKRIKCVVNFKGPLSLFVHVINFFTISLVLLNYASYRRRAARIFFKSYYYLLILLILNSSKIKKSNLCYTRGITPKRVTSGGAHLRGLAPGLRSPEETSQRWRSVGDTVSILLTRNLNPRSPAPIASALSN